jgi:peroxiredoxin
MRLVFMEVKIKVGDKTSDFVLYDTELKPRRLSDFLGKNVVLAFYVGAFTSVCTKEMCTFRDSLTRLSSLKAQVIGISVNDPFANKAFAQTNMIQFPLLSDYDRGVIRTFGIELHDFAGLKGYSVARRSVFVIDKEGIVRYVWMSEDPHVEPNYEEVEKALSQLG